MDGCRTDIGRDRLAAGAAVAVVLLLVGLQLCRGVDAGRSGEAARARGIEQIIEAGLWVEGMERAQTFLLRCPLERRAHLYVSQCQLARNVPEAALQHLTLAAAPPPAGSPAQLLPLPSVQETGDILSQLEERFPDAMGRDVALLRRARLAAMRSDWPAFESHVRGAAAAAAALSRPEDSLGTAGTAFLASVLTVPPGQVERIGLQPESVDALVRLAGMMNGPRHLLATRGPGMLPFVAVLAGGSFTGGEHMLWAGGDVRRYPAAGGWLFAALDPTTGEPLAELRCDLAPLTDERATVESWRAALPEDTAVVGLASGEAVAAMSQEGRVVLGDVWNLAGVPGPGTLTAMAFIARHQPSGPPQVVEACGVAPDMPAMLVLPGGGQG